MTPLWNFSSRWCTHYCRSWNKTIVCWPLLGKGGPENINKRDLILINSGEIINRIKGMLMCTKHSHWFGAYIQLKQNLSSNLEMILTTIKVATGKFDFMTGNFLGSILKNFRVNP